MKRWTKKIAAPILVAALPLAASAEDLITTKTNNFGAPGKLIELPSAELAPDGQLSTTLGYHDGYSRMTLSFQILPRLSGSFRLVGIDDLTPANPIYYDRSFDLRYRFLDEGRFTPAMAIGLQDFVGTSVLAAEYIVATKTIGDRLTVSGGIGWGRLGSYNSFGSSGSRAGFDPASEGGKFSVDDWFRGDYSFFGGASFDVTDRLTFSAEYSSDAYDREVATRIFERKTPWNFSLSYQVRDDVELTAYSLHGSKIGARVNLSLNPKKAPAPGGTELAPVPVAVRPAGSAADLGWTTEPDTQAAVVQSVANSLDKDGIDLDGINLQGTSAHIRIENETYDIQSQAFGRTLRVLSRTLPSSVETLNVTIMAKGMPVSTMTFNRSDLERLENAPAADALAVARFEDPLRFSDFPAPLDGLYPRFNWWIGPYTKTVFFDVNSPIMMDAGIRAKAEYNFGSGFIASGSVSYKLIGSLDEAQATRGSKLPHVRTSLSRYLENEDPVLDRLTLAKYFRPAPNLYGRVTAGYLETAYAGVSAEMLWKPVDSRLAFGVEANYVEPRAFDQQFGLRSRNTPGGVIPRASGHVSAYYDLGNGFHTQVDMGRYLAGDWGATVSLDREFANGWRVGAFATKTNVSSTQFGDGSFDKGIRIDIPMSWAIGKPTRKTRNITLRPFTRDGGARLNIDGRLYDTIRDAHEPEVAKSWGKFWR